MAAPHWTGEADVLREQLARDREWRLLEWESEDRRAEASSYASSGLFDDGAGREW